MPSPKSSWRAHKPKRAAGPRANVRTSGARQTSRHARPYRWQPPTHPFIASEKGNGAPERIRTSDPQIRSLVLYPAELRARAASEKRCASRMEAVGYAVSKPIARGPGGDQNFSTAAAAPRASGGLQLGRAGIITSPPPAPPAPRAGFSWAGRGSKLLHRRGVPPRFSWARRGSKRLHRRGGPPRLGRASAGPGGDRNVSTAAAALAPQARLRWARRAEARSMGDRGW
jgi:hypothetical protein